MTKVLIVDDDPVYRAVAEVMLDGSGYDVLIATDGDEALRIAAAMEIDVVVLDMLMPNKDGLETIIELRRLRSTTRILAVSSGGSLGKAYLLDMAMTLGADDVLPKPVIKAEFVTKVDALAARAAMLHPITKALDGSSGNF